MNRFWRRMAHQKDPRPIRISPWTLALNVAKRRAFERWGVEIGVEPGALQTIWEMAYAEATKDVDMAHYVMTGERRRPIQ